MSKLAGACEQFRHPQLRTSRRNRWNSHVQSDSQPMLGKATLGSRVSRPCVRKTRLPKPLGQRSVDVCHLVKCREGDTRRTCAFLR
jgi:hypothetical protein